HNLQWLAHSVEGEADNLHDVLRTADAQEACFFFGRPPRLDLLYKTHYSMSPRGQSLIETGRAGVRIGDVNGPCDRHRDVRGCELYRSLVCEHVPLANQRQLAVHEVQPVRYVWRWIDRLHLLKFRPRGKASLLHTFGEAAP